MAQFALNPLKFQDIKDQIVQYLTDKNEYSGQFDFSSSNLTYFVDTMAYVTMLMSYNTTNVANNLFLDTTEIRKNAVSLAKQLGYKPKRPYSAKFQGTLIYKGINFNLSNRLVIPARSPFVGSFGNIYLNTKPIELTFKGNPTQLEGEYILTEGNFERYSISATGVDNFNFVLNNKAAEEDHFSLYVIPNTITNLTTFNTTDLTQYAQYKWNLVNSFDVPNNLASISDKNIFFMEEEIISEGCPKIVFGNDFIGNKPSVTDTIVCEYLSTKGTKANNENLISLPPTDKLSNAASSYMYYKVSELGEDNKNIFSLANFSTNYQHTNNKSFGGSDLEGIDSIKYNAPKFYSFVGKTITKNDYLYYLNSLPEVKNANVVSGDELYPNDVTKLGNIYIALVPNISDTEFVYGNNIYISGEIENKIRFALDESSALSTRRYFYKPTYIIIDITPTIEIPSNTPVVESNKVKQLVVDLLVNYFANRYNKLGVSFRESKLSSVIDGLDVLTSSYLNLDYYFVINNNTVANMTDGIDNYMYLPVKKSDGISLTNFIKTNEQIVKEDILPSIDWSVLNTVVTPDNLTQFVDKIQLLNAYMLEMDHTTSSISGKLISPNSTNSVNKYNLTDTYTIKIIVMI
jgi:hypothetical protein